MTTGQQQYYKGTGRRKRAVAQVRIFSGAGAIVVNGEPIEDAMPMPHLRNIALEPLRVTGNTNRFSAMVKINGGGVSAQAGALSHGLARALLEADPAYRVQLRKFGLLTRDPREKERRKYGLRKARKAKQYTKR
ncbi:MAG: 30S ribosomal protein S9 [Chloroflexi bacterium]|nr:30S ribosomal protein S9 [Chloroflexota bacterium]